MKAKFDVELHLLKLQYSKRAYEKIEKYQDTSRYNSFDLWLSPYTQKGRS